MTTIAFKGCKIPAQNKIVFFSSANLALVAGFLDAQASLGLMIVPD